MFISVVFNLRNFNSFTLSLRRVSIYECVAHYFLSGDSCLFINILYAEKIKTVISYGYHKIAHTFRLQEKQTALIHTTTLLHDILFSMTA